MKRWLPVLAVLAVCFPAARWWYEHVRYASEQHVEAAALLGALVLLALAARERRDEPAKRFARSTRALHAQHSQRTERAAHAESADAAHRVHAAALPSAWPCALALFAYALAWRTGLALPGAACAALALAAAASRSWLGSPLRLELAGLALLCLPSVPLVQFQLGHVLRAATASAAATWLALAGFDAASAGTGLVVAGQHVWVDEPCSGLRGLWAGAYIACAAALVLRVPLARTLGLLAAAPLLVFAANVLRAAMLALLAVHSPSDAASAHTLVGLTVEGGALCALVWLARRAAGARACAT